MVIGGNTIKFNTLQDSGGNAIFTSDGSGNLSSVNSAFGSGLVLINSQTASDSASISFTSGIDSTYGEYIFKFYNINPATDVGDFVWQANASGQSGYNEEITSSMFRSRHMENDSAYGLEIVSASDQSQGNGTAFQQLCQGIGNGADENAAGELHLFYPSSTTYNKQFYSVVSEYDYRDSSRTYYMGGYLNTAAAITEVQFKMKSGNFDGIIKLYGMT